MAVEEHNGILTYKDESGGMHLLYPVTRADCVEGMDEVEQRIADAGAAAQTAQAAAVAAQATATAAQTKANAVEQQVNSGGRLAAAFAAGTGAPVDANLFWIDTTPKTGGLKYFNGSAWVHVPVAYT